MIRINIFRDTWESEAVKNALRASFKRNFSNGSKKYKDYTITPDYERAKLVVTYNGR